MTIRIGTRGSDLALWQARHVAAALAGARAGLDVELVVITTSGDKATETLPPAEAGKGVFTREIEQALLDGRVDLAVHSLKDLPTQLPDGLTIAAVIEREDPADAMISHDGGGLADIAPGGEVMTGSRRRAAQILHARPDVKVVPVRGNVPTRVRKFNESGADAIILARAGLLRLGLGGMITRRLDPAEFLPACGQGALAVEIRSGDRVTAGLAVALEHAPTRLCVTAEREFLAALGGGCQAPVGAYARIAGSRLVMTAMVAGLDGKAMVRHEDLCQASDMAATELGRRMHEHMRGSGVDGILAEIRDCGGAGMENP